MGSDEFEVVPVAPDLDRKAEQAEAAKIAAVQRAWTRDQAVARGAALGLAEGTRRGEAGKDLSERVSRAEAYAAWEYDGKPAGGNHLEEFQVASPTLAIDRVVQPDFKTGGKK